MRALSAVDRLRTSNSFHKLCKGFERNYIVVVAQMAAGRICVNTISEVNSTRATRKRAMKSLGKAKTAGVDLNARAQENAGKYIDNAPPLSVITRVDTRRTNDA